MVATTNGAFAATAYLLASYRAQATPVLQSISAGSATTVGTSALSGTTGTDAKMNVACTDGHIFVENRLGSTRTFMIFLAA